MMTFGKLVIAGPYWYRGYVGRQPVTSKQNTTGKAIAFEKIHWNAGMQYFHTL